MRSLPLHQLRERGDPVMNEPITEKHSIAWNDNTHAEQTTDTFILPCLVKTVYRPFKSRLRVEHLRLQPYFCEIERMLKNFWYHSRNLIWTEWKTRTEPDSLTLPKARSLTARSVAESPALPSDSVFIVVGSKDVNGDGGRLISAF